MTTELPSASMIDALRQQLADKEREIAALKARLDEVAHQDELTGVLNRRSLLQNLEAELQRSRRTGHPFCFAIIDIDHFKSVNEAHGHDTGDRVLAALSAAAVKLLRVVDRFGRLGGEEFGIVLPSTWLDQGTIAMRRLTDAIAAVPWSTITPGSAVTFSGGLTTNSPTDTVESMTQRAEKALRQAKAEGRNRVVVLEEELPDMSQMNLD